MILTHHSIRHLRPLRLATLAAALLMAAALSGCAGSSYQDSPVGTGPGATDLKKSPCACTTLPNPGVPAKIAG